MLALKRKETVRRWQRRAGRERCVAPLLNQMRLP
jgi:hypothetical protein